MFTILAICLLALARSELVGPITITEFGVPQTRYVVSTYSPLASTNGTSLMLQHNSQVQIANVSQGTYSPYMFEEYKLSGRTISYTVDISSVGCSCNAAMYLVTMPGYGSDGQPAGGDSGDYYCDANDVNSEWCWEMDVMEANMYTMATTPHTCDQAPGTPIYNCDRGGCGTNAYYVDSKGMCPDSSCKINTMQPFKQSITFGSTIVNTLTQNGQTFQFQSCNDNGYINNMAQAFDYGMVMVFSYWGSDYNTMSWLDQMTGCGGDCAGSGTAVWSDISIS